MIVSVAIDLALDRLFSYSVPDNLAKKLLVGQLLRVPFGGRIARGFALAIKDEAERAVPASAQNDEPRDLFGQPLSKPAEKAFTLKPILAIEDESPFFSPTLLKLVKWIAHYTHSPIETTLKAALPAAVLKPSIKPKELLYVEPVTGEGGQPPKKSAGGQSPEDKRGQTPVKLTPHQAELLKEIQRVGGGWLQQLVHEFKTSPATLKSLAEKGVVAIAPRVSRRDPLAGRRVMPSKPLALNPQQQQALDIISSATKPVLLHGVTGSGKTEIYLQAIARVLERGQGAIVLVPEISLTPQTVRRFAARFGEQVAVLHSALSDGERYDEWHRIRTGEARVVVGPRSAVFAPVRNLGLIVVDEEHDPSYKQDETPRYHARDVAVVRAQFEGAGAVLGSATPSLESWLNAQTGKYVLASVPNRVAGRALPQVHLINMEQESEKTGHPPIFSQPLLDALHLRLERGEQTILFLNRRGYSRVLECPDCGWVAECPDCSVPYTYHQADHCLRCHVCGGWTHLPSACPDCKNREFNYTGIGTQRAEAALQRCFPHARVLRMDADSTSRKFSHDDILSTFRAGRADVLLGTQMIAKGLDFPNVTLVGVLNADTSLHRPDPRASERTYQLLAQVSGRAGRAEKPGEVYLQTFAPDAPAIAAAASDKGFTAFAAQELAARKEAYLPPYCRLATLVFRSKVEEVASSWADLYAKSLTSWAKQFNTARQQDLFRVSEAAEAPLLKAEGWFRYQVVVRAPSTKDIVSAVKWIESERPAPKELRLVFDVDAQNLS
ncbi:MAG: primosomal protein N' [Kiritimatiellae bacterium]|nr:primosomal protein N' [Kiritimatiellia bacterium]